MMWPYFVMVGIPAIVALFGNFLKNSKLRNRLVILSFFSIWLLLLIFRNETIGIDIHNYKYLFREAAHMSFGDIFLKVFDFRFESGFYFFSKTISVFTMDFRAFIVLSAIVSLVPIAFLYFFHARQNSYLSIVIFLSIGLFAIFFSALRQTMALAFVVPAYYFVRNRKPLLFLLMVLLAFLFHNSSLIMLILYPIYHINLRLNRSLFLIVPVIILVYIFRNPIFSWMSFIINDFYEGEIQETGAVMIFLLLLAFLVFSYIIPDNTKLDKDTVGLRNLLLLCTIIQIFAGINSLAMRVNYYFLIFVPILIPRIINSATEKNKKAAYLSFVLMIGFFTLWFFFRAYTVKSALHIFPYVPMWSA